MKIFIVVVFLLLALQGKAQTDVNISQHYLGRMNFNPAATGVDPDAVNLRAFFREQWMGFDRAPSTQIINIDNYFKKYNSGAGLIFINDKIGFSKNMNFKLSYAYKFRLNPESYVSLGMSLGLIHNYSDERDFRPEHENDPDITYMVSKETLADFDIGAEYYWRELNVGFSISHITKGKEDKKVTPHYYAYANYGMNLDEDWRLTPSLFMALNHKSRLYELGAISEYRSKFNFGMMYRANEKFRPEALIGILGLYISDYASVGYSYDFTIGQEKPNASGAHELFMSFRIEKGKKGRN